MVIFVVMMVFLIICQRSEAMDIKEGQIITLQEAINIALVNHPDMRSAEGTVKIYESRLGQSKSDYYPDINISSGLTRYSSGMTETNLTSSMNVSQNIYDFGKRELKVQIESTNLDASKEDLFFTRSQVIFNVKKAYYNAIQSKNSLDVAKYVLKQYYQHYTKAKSFYEVGMKPKYELTKAEVDLANSKVNLLKADNNYKIAMTNLKNAIALYDAPDFEIQDETIFNYELEEIDELIKKALLSRQDYRSLELKEVSQKKRIDYEKTGYYPSINANAKYGYSGDRLPLDKSWLIGANLTIPLFSGFQTKYQVDEAMSTLKVVQAQKELLRQKIVLEVRQAYLNIKDARQRLEASEVTLRYAEENYKLATGRYEAGVGSPIEVTDAISVYSNARNSYITAKYDLLLAIADMKRATGSDLGY